MSIPSRLYTPAEGRECGECYACCVWLGIEELRKYSGQSCKHLNGSGDGTKRCSIYASRPKACSAYSCMWLHGFGQEELYPPSSGMLLTSYNSETIPGTAALTVSIFDAAKAEGLIPQLMADLMAIEILTEVRLVWAKEKRATLFREGKIYNCRILPPDGFESLRFEAKLPHIGTYQLRVPPNGQDDSQKPEGSPAHAPPP